MYKVIKYCASLKWKPLDLSKTETLCEAMNHIKVYSKNDPMSYFRIYDLDNNDFVGGCLERGNFKV